MIVDAKEIDVYVGRTNYWIDHWMPEIRPAVGSASVSNAAGEKSRSLYAHASHLSVRLTLTVLPWSVIEDNDQRGVEEEMDEFYVQVTTAVFPHIGLVFGLTPS